MLGHVVRSSTLAVKGVQGKGGDKAEHTTAAATLSLRSNGFAQQGLSHEESLLLCASFPSRTADTHLLLLLLPRWEPTFLPSCQCSLFAKLHARLGMPALCRSPTTGIHALIPLHHSVVLLLAS